jgi:hypothetical protein
VHVKAAIYARYSTDKRREPSIISPALRIAFTIILTLLPSLAQAKFNFYTAQSYAASFIGKPIATLVEKWGPPSENT